MKQKLVLAKLLADDMEIKLVTAARMIGPMDGLDLRESRCWSVRNMTNEQIRESVIDDLLSFLYVGIGYVTFEVMTADITDRTQLLRVRSALRHKDVRSKLIFAGHRFKIRCSRENLQACMDYAGCWHQSFEPYATSQVA